MSGSVVEVRVLGGTASLLGSVAHNITDGTSKTLALVCSGTSISVQLNGSTVLGPYTNTEFSDVGKAGIGSGSLTPQNFSFVSWTAADDTSGGSGGGAVAYLSQL